jgi:hypothetical protein
LALVLGTGTWATALTILLSLFTVLSIRLKKGNPDLYGRVLQAGNKAKRKVGKDDGNTTTTTTTTGTTTNTTTTGNTLETKEEGAPVPKVDVPLVTIYINGVPCHPTTMVTLLQKQSEASTTDSANQSAKQSAKQSANNTSASTTTTTTSTTTDTTTTTNTVVEVPSDAVADRLNFIINNSTDSNVLAKVREARDVLEPKYFKWLANQLVVKRICTQPNYHPTYLKFVTGLKMDGFEEAVSPMLCFLCFLPYV